MLKDRSRLRWLAAVVAWALVCGAAPAAAAEGGGSTAPPNDWLVRAERISVGETANGNTFGATPDDWTDTDCWISNVVAVWYEFEAVADGLALVHVDSPIDVGAALYEGTRRATMSELACDDSRIGAGRERTGHVVRRGERYAVAVVTLDPNIDAPFEITVHQPEGPPPPNDAIVDAVPIDVGVFSGTTVGATREEGEPVSDCAWDPTPTVWYQLEPQTVGDKTIRLTSDSDQGFDVFEGTGPGDMQLIACRDWEWAGDDEVLTVTFEPLKTYWIAVRPYTLSQVEAFGLEIVDVGVRVCAYLRECVATGPLPAPKS